MLETVRDMVNETFDGGWEAWETKFCSGAWDGEKLYARCEHLPALGQQGKFQNGKNWESDKKKKAGGTLCLRFQKVLTQRQSGMEWESQQDLLDASHEQLECFVLLLKRRRTASAAHDRRLQWVSARIRWRRLGRGWREKMLGHKKEKRFWETFDEKAKELDEHTEEMIAEDASASASLAS
mmetsp:Transcript_66267/g.163211  ORF Transcript_66267/g.163211 Transcript_66267/m.163211 type:complete len:181 (-) Transcript_66267:65-607(-)